MGVPFTVTLYCADQAVANNAAQAAYARIKELNRILSDYDPDSELRQLCRSSGPGKPVKVSPELFFVLKYIDQIKILAEKKYLGCFRQGRKFKKSM